MTKKRDLNDWLNSGAYLPVEIRDFHDQKDVFKAIGEMLARYQAKAPNHHVAIKEVSWIDLQMLTIDVFLWFMAMHGYTLQQCRQNVEFRDLATRVKEAKDREAQLLRAMFEQTDERTGTV